MKFYKKIKKLQISKVYNIIYCIKIFMYKNVNKKNIKKKIRESSKKKNKLLVYESLDYLFSKALENKKDKELQKKLILQAESYCKKHKVRMPYKYRVLYCKNCKLLYSDKSIRRIKTLKYKTLNITCENCSFLRRVNLERFREAV